MIKKELLARIEGEATLEYEFKSKKIDFLKVKFMNFRGMEKIIENRAPLDAMALTPRVCGVCGQAHLITTVRALEDLYKTNGIDIEIPKKAEIIRDLTTGAEVLQSHFKWFYFSILGDLFSIDSDYSTGKPKWLKATKISRELNKIAATFAGQWPHAAFVRPGGVVSDPTTSDITDTYKILDDTIEFFEEEVISLETLESANSFEDLLNSRKDLSVALQEMEKLGVVDVGRGYNRLLTISDNLGFSQGFYNNGERQEAHIDKCKESLANTFFVENGYTYSKSALYDNYFIETGPMARGVNGKDRLITALQKQIGDSNGVRVVARVKEIITICEYLKKRLSGLKLKEKSFIEPSKNIKDLEGKGIGAFEAARGALIHTVEVKKGLIKSYDIVTPTVWNLGNGDRENPSTIQKAIIGLTSTKRSEFIFRSFDVCSVCTTQ